MTIGVDELTEKEKEALRLLVVGHDAKSSASKLGISVHTINDRLRNARRKLGVSNSREAARILGAAEGQDSQSYAHISFGMADEEPSADNAILTQAKRAEPFRFTWLAGGMLIMSILIAASIFAAISSSGADESSTRTNSVSPARTGTASASQTGNANSAALARAERFLDAVDASNWTQSWDVAGTFFQAETSRDEWADLVESVRGKLGTVESRRLAIVQNVETLPGAPEGDYEIHQYNTKFSEASIISTETLILVRNGDDFDVAGYFIR